MNRYQIIKTVEAPNIETALLKESSAEITDIRLDSIQEPQPEYGYNTKITRSGQR